MPPWITVATAELEDGGLLELHQRGDLDFLILVDGRVLMNSFSRSSEEALAVLTLAAVRAPAPRILIGGLGMGLTLRTALDHLPPKAEVTVAELNPVVVDWCKGVLGPLTNHAVEDPRVTVEVGDVAALIARSGAARFDAILLDLYEGPDAASQGRNDPFYSIAALGRTHRALAPSGVLGVWSEDNDGEFADRFTTAGFDTTTHTIASGETGHVVYVGRRTSPT